MICDHCESRHGCSIGKAHDDGTAVFSCGIDFGRDKSETVIYESRRGKLVARYNAALAAPARNCDRFATWEAALSAFREETGNSKPLELWLGCEIQLLAIWLLAPAAERKGEGDGR